MRFLKRLLVCVYVYIGIFGAACFIAWCITREEPTALITGLCAATGIESITGGIIRIRELKAEKEKKIEEEQRFYD